jgi:hypothetical protein
MTLADDANMLLAEARNMEASINAADPDQVTAAQLQTVIQTMWELRGIITYIEDMAESGLRKGTA